MVIKSKKKLDINMFIIISLSLFLLISFIHPTLYLDEQFTMSLIHHPYKNLISINMLDVHPPTYYLLLRFFIKITTFWTSSLFVKIFFARLFSFLSFILMFFYLCKLLKFCNININWAMQLFIYLLIPTIAFYSVMIRMYSLYGLFSILTIFQLICYDKRNNIKNLLLALIFAIFTSYIDYFAAVCVGLFIFILFIKNLLYKYYIKSIHLFLSGIILLLCCIPLFLIMFKQIALRKMYAIGPPININTEIINIINSFTQVSKFKISFPFFVAFIGIIVYIFKNSENKKLKSILILILLDYVLSILFASSLCLHFNVFEPKFLYPQFTLYSFIISSFLNVNISKYNSKHGLFKILFTYICIIILLNTSFNICSNVIHYIIPSYKISRIMHNAKHKKYIQVNFKDIPKNVIPVNGGKALYITQLSTYFQYYNRFVVVKNCKYNKISLYTVSGNTKLMRLTFNNLK